MNHILTYIVGFLCISYLTYQMPDNIREGNDLMFMVDMAGVLGWFFCLLANTFVVIINSLEKQ